MQLSVSGVDQDIRFVDRMKVPEDADVRVRVQRLILEGPDLEVRMVVVKVKAIQVSVVFGTSDRGVAVAQASTIKIFGFKFL